MLPAWAIKPLIYVGVGLALLLAGWWLYHRTYMRGYDAAVAVYERAAADKALRDATRIVDATVEIHRAAVPVLIQLDRIKTLQPELDEQLTEATHEAPDYAAAVRPDAFLRLRKARINEVRRAAARPEL